MSDASATAQQRADALAAGRPVLPYRSKARNHIAVVTVAVDGGSVVIDGRPHSPAAALELSAAIARAATEIATHPEAKHG